MALFARFVDEHCRQAAAGDGNFNTIDQSRETALPGTLPLL